MTVLRTATLLATLLVGHHVEQPKSPPAPVVFTLDTTSYCQAGTMADGQETYVGAAAGNMCPFGTRIKLLSGRLAGTVVTIADRIGWGSQLDIFSPSCAWSWWYGRERVSVEIIS